MTIVKCEYLHLLVNENYHILLFYARGLQDHEKVFINSISTTKTDRPWEIIKLHNLII